MIHRCDCGAPAGVAGEDLCPRCSWEHRCAMLEHDAELVRSRARELLAEARREGYDVDEAKLTEVA